MRDFFDSRNQFYIWFEGENNLNFLCTPHFNIFMCQRFIQEREYANKFE